jgi:hypothetical protein
MSSCLIQRAPERIITTLDPNAFATGICSLTKDLINVLPLMQNAAKHGMKHKRNLERSDI